MEGRGKDTGTAHRTARPRDRTAKVDTGKVSAWSPSLAASSPRSPNTYGGQVVPDPGPPAAPVLP